MSFICPESCKAACCRNVKYLLVTVTDVAKWVENNQTSILEKLRVAEVWVEDTKFVSLIIYLGKKCPYLKKNKCSIYNMRPVACKTFPYKTGGQIGEITPSTWAKKICPVHEKYDPPYSYKQYKSIERSIGMIITFQDVLTKVIGKQRKKLVVDAGDIKR